MSKRTIVGVAKCPKCSNSYDIRLDALEQLDPFQYFICTECKTCWCRFIDFKKVVTFDNAWRNWVEDEGFYEYLEGSKEDD